MILLRKAVALSKNILRILESIWKRISRLKAPNLKYFLSRIQLTFLSTGLRTLKGLKVRLFNSNNSPQHHKKI